MYDENNPFAKILRGELQSKDVYEDDYVKAFWSIDPKAPIHILVIPKKPHIDYHRFVENAQEDEIVNLMRGVKKVAEIMNLKNGYRLIVNNGKDAKQTVFHLHIHILSGGSLPDEV